MCERTGIKCASLCLGVSWDDTSVHVVFDGSLLLHSDKAKML